MSARSLTAEGSPEAESRVRGDLDRIRSVLLGCLPPGSVDMAALIGGFGRGEGGVIRRGDALRAFNDYDLVLFTNGRPDPSPLFAAAPGLAGELGVDFVDFGVLDRSALARIEPTVFWYELLEGHLVLHGPSDYLGGVPRIDPARLPLVEATRLLTNRGLGLLWARLHLEDAGVPNAFDERRRRFTINAMHKAVLAMGEAALIRASAYHVSYRERARRIAAGGIPLPPGTGGFASAYAEATRFKLGPRIPDTPVPELGERWRTIRGWHESFFRWIEEARLGSAVGPWKDYPRRTAREALAQGIRHPRRFLDGRRSGSPLRAWSRLLLDAELSYRTELPFLLYGIGPDGPDVDLLASGLRGFGAGAPHDARHWRALAGALVGAWHP